MATDVIHFAPGLAVDEREIELTFIRAAGPGGQNVNKVATAVQLRFDAGASPAVDEEMLARLRRIAGRRMTEEGVIVITARRHRTQEANRRDALARLEDMLRRAAIAPRKRRPTAPGPAARRRRLEEKQRRSHIKALRSRVKGEDR